MPLRAGLDGGGGLRLIVPDTMPTINDAVREALGTDRLLLRRGVHQVGEPLIQQGLFHGNQPAYMENEVVLQKQLTVVGEPGAEVHGVTVLEETRNISCWRPVPGGGRLEGIRFEFRDDGMHGVCVAVEGGDWEIDSCEVRSCGRFSKAVWTMGGKYVFDDSFRGKGQVVEDIR